MSNADNRKLREINNLFGDPKFARQAWKSIGNAIAARPATTPIVSYDKNGDETYDSRVQSYSYKQLYDDINSLGDAEREPTQLEMILMCQMVKARTDTAAATFIRDTLGAKPIDESKVELNDNPYEQLTDEELALIAAHREQLAQQASIVEHSPIVDKPYESGEQLSLFSVEDDSNAHT